MKKLLLSLSLMGTVFGVSQAQEFNFCKSDSVSYYSLNITNNDSLLVFKTYNKYNATSQLVADSSFQLNNFPNDYVWLYKDVYNYTNNNRTYWLYQYWNDTTSTWQNFSQIFSSYNSNNLKLVDSSQEWNSTTNTWKNNSKDAYTYYPNNKLKEGFGSFWDIGINDWFMYDKDSFSYTNNGDILKKVSTYFNGSTWVTHSIDNYIYDGQNRLIVLKKEGWNFDQTSFIVKSLDSFFYNSTNQIILNKSYVDNGAGALVYDSKGDIFYNQNGYVSYVIYYGDWDASSNAFQSKGKTVYHCPFATSIDEYLEAKKLNVDIFPNPIAKQQQLSVTIEKESSYQIVNSIGQQVGQGNLNKGLNTVSIVDLTSGNYFIFIKSGNSVIQKKFIIK